MGRGQSLPERSAGTQGRMLPCIDLHDVIANVIDKGPEPTLKPPVPLFHFHSPWNRRQLMANLQWNQIFKGN